MSTYNNSYSTTNNNEHKTTAREDFELSKDMLGVMGVAKDEVVGAKEEAAKARVDQYSTEKATEQNHMYEEYMEGAIGNNFKKQTELLQRELAFERSKAEYEIAKMHEEVAKEKAEFEEKMVKEKAEFGKEKREFEKSKKQMILWRFFWPALGIICGALSYIVLFVLK